MPQYQCTTVPLPGGNRSHKDGPRRFWGSQELLRLYDSMAPQGSMGWRDGGSPKLGLSSSSTTTICMWPRSLQVTIVGADRQSWRQETDAFETSSGVNDDPDPEPR